MMTGYKPARKSVDIKDTQEHTNELNTFYVCLDHTVFSAVQEKALGSVREEQISGL